MSPLLASLVLPTAAAVVLVVVVTVAIRERLERRRLERALAVARQLPRFPADPADEARARQPDRRRGDLIRFWLLPLAAILFGLLVTAWSVWNVLAR